MPVFQAAELRRVTTRLFAMLDVPQSDAETLADHLVEADLAGVTSHGLMRIPQYVEAIETGEVRPDGKLSVVSEGPAVAVLDGQGGLGQVMARAAMEVAIDRAENNGIGAVTLVNCGHTGRLASYTLQAAARGFIGMMMVNAGGRGQWVAPFGGAAGRLSTNPLSFAVPRGDGDPVLVDIATSVVPEGKIRAVLTAGKSAPAGWLNDSRGEPTTNPADLYGPPRGALRPVGEHKGYGLAMIVDLLAGGLSGAGVCSRDDAPSGGGSDGVFMIAVRVASFCPTARLAELANDLIEHVTSCPAAPGVEKVLFPGEIEARQRRENLRNGLTIDDGIWDSIRSTLARFGLEESESTS